jgi:hypothetical protein
LLKKIADDPNKATQHQPEQDVLGVRQLLP